jgi:uncharacterized protein DUF1631
MAKSASGNVVPLGDHPRARSRLTPKESADVLVGCRELALDRMVVALAGMLDRVEDDLFDLADKAVDREMQNTYLDARAAARDKRKAIEATFRQHFLDLFNRKVRGEVPPARRESDPGELTLVGHEDLEETIAVREMARKLGAACEGELFALGQRVGFLLERPELADDANPLSPATVCAALKDACDQLDAGFKVRMALLRQFELYAEGELQHVYHDLNAHLVERRILPDVRVGVRRASPSTPPQPPRPAKQEPQGAAGNADLFGTLAQLIGATLAGNNAAPSAAGPARGPSAPQAWPLAPGAAGGAPSAPASFMAELTRMHREGGPAITAADEVLVNVVRNIKAAPQSASLGTVDAMTIDIVAMLFDYIFEDRHIPASVKALLGRLQIPVLKVALLDKSFFSSKTHPARRLIDLLAESAIGLDESNAAEGAVVALIEGVVQSVLTEFDTDIALFESLVARVEAFIAERKTAEYSVVERSARLIEERERGEIARLVAEDEVIRRIELRAWVPSAVRTMLHDSWVRALTDVHLNEGEGSSAWQAMLQSVEDLLWSVEPKVSPEDRKRLVTMLPGMLKTLEGGLERARTPQEARDAFLGALVDCHAAAVKSGLRGMAALPEPPPPAVQEDASIAREMVPAGDIQVSEIRLKTPRGKAAVRNVFTRTGIWTNLQRGTWVEFAACGTGPGMRARLTWISPNKGVYLFTNPLSSAAAVSISPEALAEQMRLGEARMLDDAPLVDRAVDSMLANLRRSAA